MNDKIISRIKKLLALTESSNEHESQNAMLKVQEMLAKHRLSLQEVEEFKTEKVNVEERDTNITFTTAKWKGFLAKVIADNFGCYIFFRRNRTNKIVFLGRDEDVEICHIMLDYAMDSIKSSTNRIKNENKKLGLSTKGIENDYSLGFIKGLEKRFEEQKDTHAEWGLILVKPKEVVDTYNDMFKCGMKSASLKTKYQGNVDAYNQGQKDGKKFDISSRIAEECKEPQCLL